MRIWTIAGEAQGWMWFSRFANISQTGVYLATDAPFDAGYQFAIEIDLPNDKGQIKGKCKVIWVNEIEAEDYPKGMGVHLFELEPKDRELLEEYLKELENA
jgi:Tfp pilus assembly protein PilZ